MPHQPLNHRWGIAAFGASAWLLACGVACARGVPDYGFQWATVTHPGNRPASRSEAPDFYPPYSTPALLKGRVDYTYRISVTEVTTAQWFEFVEAYAPYYSGARTNSSFTSLFIYPTVLDPDQPPAYAIAPGFERVAASMSWYMAARYCNWLENGKRSTPEAFETGVYDTATFTRNPDGTWPVPSDRSPGAHFWIPTLDEWIKAAYYSPDRYGEGVEGYWTRPNRSDSPLIPGYPDEGGQTSAGIPPPTGEDGIRYLDVGSYPDVVTPWGLLDASGGVSEWLGTGPNQGSVRDVKGSYGYLGGYDPVWTDRLDTIGGASATGSVGGLVGLRLAGVVPSPPSLFALAIVPLLRRRGRSVRIAGS